MSYDSGDTARISTSISDIDGNAADPGTLVFRMMRPNGNEFSYEYVAESGSIVREEKGKYYVDIPLNEVGDWPYRWEGSGSVGVAEEGALTVHGSVFEFAAAGILPLAEYKKRRQLTEASQERDESIEAALLSAEDTVLKYTGRDFTTAQAVETRQYPWEVHTMILETDDFVGAPTTIALEAPGGIAGPIGFPTSAYWLGPHDEETNYWIDFTPAKNLSLTSIGQMGFMRNLDTIYSSHRGSLDIVTVNVSAKFGWPKAAPASIKQAVTWLADGFRKNEGTQGDLQAEGIADLSYVYQRLREEQHELPARVMALLDPYRRLAL
jgi:hypothetical protein